MGHIKVRLKYIYIYNVYYNAFKKKFLTKSEKYVNTNREIENFKVKVQLLKFTVKIWRAFCNSLRLNNLQATGLWRSEVFKYN